MFTRWGAFVYRRRRWLVLLAFVVAGGLGSLAGSASAHLTSGGWLDPTSESAQVADRLEADFGGGRTSFVALFRSTDPTPTPRRRPSRPRSRRPSRPCASSTASPALTGYAETRDDRFISVKGDAAYVLIGLNMTEDRSVALVDPIKQALATPSRLLRGADRLRPDPEGLAAALREGPHSAPRPSRCRSPRSC